VIADDRLLGGNSTANPRLLTFEDGSKAIWKRDQPNNSAEAEIMVYGLNNLLGFDVVPETVMLPRNRRDGSCQRFIDGAQTAMDVYEQGEEKYLDVLKANRERAESNMVLDWISGNMDRHMGNQIFDADGRLWAVDNGWAQDWEARGGWYFGMDFLQAFPDSKGDGPKTIKLSPEIINKVRAIDSIEFSNFLSGSRFEKHFRLAWTKMQYIQQMGELVW